jgi:hypothetical protein
MKALLLFLPLFIIFLLSFLFIFIYLYFGKPCAKNNNEKEQAAKTSGIITVIVIALFTFFNILTNVSLKTSLIRLSLATIWVWVVSFLYVLFSKQIIHANVCPQHSSNSGIQSIILTLLIFIGLFIIIFIVQDIKDIDADSTVQLTPEGLQDITEFINNSSVRHNDMSKSSSALPQPPLLQTPQPPPLPSQSPQPPSQSPQQPSQSQSPQQPSQSQSPQPPSQSPQPPSQSP